MAKLFLVAGLLVLFGKTSAQLAYEDYRAGSNINTAVINNAYDITRFSATPPSGHSYTNDNPVVDVLLEFKDIKKNYFPTNWKLEIRYTITLYNKSLATTTISNEYLTVNYDKNQSFKDIDIKSYPGYIRGNVSVTTVLFTNPAVGGTPTNIPANTDLINWEDLVLTVRYTPDYIYSKNTTINNALIPKHVGHPTTDFCTGTAPLNLVNEMPLSWAPQLEAQSYDFEWVFVDMPDEDFSSALVTVDWRNAMRVNIPNASYSIPLAYPRGKIVYRARVISLEWDAANSVYYRYEGPWTFGNGLTTQEIAINDKCYFNYCGMEPDKNWAYTASFAEDGKKGEQLSFLDATGRSRRDISYNYQDNKAIISKTYYDKQGRAAVQALPVPVTNKGNDFYDTYADDFDHSDFDQTAALANAPAMSSTQPSAAYYSYSNPFLTGNTQQLDYIPYAEGYPYVQTQFKNDGSGRPEAISAPGIQLRIGSGHETRFYYAGVEGQQLLDRLFGNEVGFSEHYKRNMTVDPNGVTSVSYVDGSGRVIATALAGSSSKQNVENVTHNTEAISVNLLENMVIGDDGSVSNTKEIIVPVAGTYTFNYSLQAASFDLECFGSRPCKYNVTITISNEAGVLQTITYNSSSITTLSLTDITSQTPAISFTASLVQGKYTVQKTISLSSSTDAYVGELEEHVREAGPGPNNPCIPQDLPGVECLTCAEKCERVYKYEVNYNGNNETVWVSEDGLTLYTNSQALADAFPNDFVLDLTGQYTNPIETLITECQNRCANPQPQINMGECDMMRQVLLMDVSPGGQYFDNHPVTWGDSDPDQADKDMWLNMFIPVSVKDDLFNLAGVSTWEELRGAWDDGMGVYLLPFHPEFCQYNYFCNVAGNMGAQCCKGDAPPANIYTTSSEYDAAMHIGHDDTYGIDNHFFDPLDDGPVPALYKGGDCASRDPYFCANPAGHTQMLGYLTNYIENPWGGPGAYFSIWDILWNDGTSYTASTPEEQSLIDFLGNMQAQFNSGPLTRYQFFRAYYQGRKRKIIQDAYPAWAAENCSPCTNFMASACATCVTDNNLNVPPNPEDCHQCWLSAYDAGHDNIVDAGYTAPACSNATTTSGDFNLEDFNIRYPYINVLDPHEVTTEDLCETHCSAYANYWTNQLADPWMGCELETEFTQDMRDYLYNQFYNYCMGECTVLDVTLGEQPDFGTPAAQTALNDIVNGFRSIYHVDLCPTLLTANPTATSKLPCQCSNLAEMISTAGALISPYASPLHYLLYGVPVGSVVDMGMAITWINNHLEDVTGTNPNYTTGTLQSWLSTCTEGLATTIPDLPAEMGCSIPENDGLLDCVELNTPLNELFIQNLFETNLNALLAQYQIDLRNKCLAGLYQRETFTVSYTLDEFQYTLYYYDRAGNLIKTVPPAGVQTLSGGTLSFVDTYRNAAYTAPDYSHTAPGSEAPLFRWPNHKLVTKYKYNSLEQLVEQTTPDAGTSKFWYDAFGRLVLSQNAKQAAAANKRFSYTKYDAYGRIQETGEITTTTVPTIENTADPSWLTSFYTSTATSRIQVTYTRYDEAQTGTNLPAQANLRNRVASSYYFEVTPNVGLTNYVHATHYSYDVHGHVAKSIQDFPFLNQFGMRFAETEYEYELVSGNMKKVAYRKGKLDQFFHKYEYDASSRLITVLTSRDGKIWEADAKYFYQPHGPLYRVETGDKKIQGTDYAQTIQGWHKAVNAQRLNPGINATTKVVDAGSDMGMDGRNILATGDLNHLIARDAFGYSLTYFIDDYSRIGASKPAFEPSMSGNPIGTYMLGLGTTVDPKGQYNGNITTMVTALRDATEAPTEELGQVFRYDQLYRLTSSRTFVRATATDFTWIGINQTSNRWATNYAYDANGNIISLQRYNEVTSATLIDNMTYGYHKSGSPARLNSNRLYNVNDAATASTVVEDYRVPVNGTFSETTATTSGKFEYDEIGNLTKDKGNADELNIEWNLYGKVKKVTRTTGSKMDLEFYYDAAGRRVMKIAKPHNAPTDKTQWKYTLFTYDAGGQLMAEYDVFYFFSTYNLMQKGRYLYGSSKMGKTKDNFSVTPTGLSSYTSVETCTSCATASLVTPLNESNAGLSTKTYARTLGQKQYEFTNHLGNVLVTLSDRRLLVDDGTYTYSGSTLTQTAATSDGRLDYYLPDVLTSTDYYPGGMAMPGRTFEGSACTTTSTANSPVYTRNDAFTSNNASYTGVGTNVLPPVASGGIITISKPSATSGIWGTRTPVMSLVGGRTYVLSYTLTLPTCTGTSAGGWRLLDASLAVVASGTVTAAGSITATITPPASGNYYLEFYRNTTLGVGTCTFTLDNVALFYTTYTHTTTCGTPGTADMYLWGHNDQFKDNEIYGNGNAYTAEYWEYDARLLRRWNVDPITYEWQSPYNCFDNNPIYYSDPFGLEATGPEPRRKPKRGSRPKFEDQTLKTGNKFRKGSKKWSEAPLEHIENPKDHYGADNAGRFWNWLTGRQYKNHAYDKMVELDLNGAVYTVKGNNKQVVITEWKRINDENTCNVIIREVPARTFTFEAHAVDSFWENSLFSEDESEYLTGVAPDAGIGPTNFNIRNIIKILKDAKTILKVVRSSKGIPKSVARIENLAKKFKLSASSPTTQQILNSLDDSVEAFISKYRKSSIRSEIPGEFLKEGVTVRDALKSGNSTIRKLLTDSRFVK